MPKPTKGLSADHLKFNLALERLSVVDDGRICYRIKDTDPVRLMTPVQFLARLSALVPAPRHPLVRLYGVWAPHSQWRSRVVTAAPATKTRVICATSTATGPRATPVTPAGLSIIGARGAAATPPTPETEPKPEAPLAPSHPAGEELRFSRPSGLAWATLYESSASTRSSARAAADGCASSSDRRRRPGAQRAPPSKPARAATAVVSRALARMGRLKRGVPP